MIRSPDSQGHARLIKRREQGIVEHFITQASIEALDEAIQKYQEFQLDA